MFKQSYGLVLVQVVNIALSLLITLYIAASVDPIAYSVMVVYLIITSIMSTFSFAGYETVLIRNALHWDDLGKKKKIKNYVSYALISRFLISAILAAPLFAYLEYLSEHKYNGKYTLLFTLFIVSGFFQALSNSNTLILRSFNRYILSYLITIIGGLLGKAAALYAFIKYGFISFISILIVTPAIIFFISFYFIRLEFDIKTIRLKYFFKLKRYRYFILSGYTKYVTGYSDQLLISIFLPVELLSSYSIAKRLQEVSKSVIEGFFDPLTQRSVIYKDNSLEKQRYFRKLKSIRGVGLLLIGGGASFVIYFISEIISITNLVKYAYLDVFLLFSIFSSIFYLAYKVEANLSSIFLSQYLLFKIDVGIAILSILSFLLFVCFLRVEYVYANRFLIELVSLVVFYTVFARLINEKSLNSDV